MPIAMPTIAPSASGVSITRCSPNLARRPSVTRKTPPSTPMSSPSTRTSSSRSISCISARLMAWTIVSFRGSVIPCSPRLIRAPPPRRPRAHARARRAAPGALRSAPRRCARRRRGGLACIRASARSTAVRISASTSTSSAASPAASSTPFVSRYRRKPRQRLPRLPLLHLGVVAILRRIVGRGVERQPVGQGLDQRRPFAPPRAIHRLARRHVAGEQVVAVDLDPREAVGDRLLGERPRVASAWSAAGRWPIDC